MSSVTAIRHIEDCLDGGSIREFELDAPLDEPLMQRMADKGTLRYYPDFPRPYFRIERRGAYTIQGVLGNRTLRVTFPRAARANMEENLKLQIETGETHGC